MVGEVLYLVDQGINKETRFHFNIAIVSWVPGSMWLIKVGPIYFCGI